MATRTDKSWWQRVRGRNRTLKGLISARRRFTARMDRLSGKQPLKRHFSVPAIARRIGAPLPLLKRIIRGQEEAPLATLTRLARDLGLPAAELRAVLEEQGPAAGTGTSPNLSGAIRSGDPLKQLEAGLIESARAFVALLRNYSAEPPKGSAKVGKRRKKKR